jgi:hypothetical protein
MEEQHYGEVLAEWSAPAYPHYHRGALWYGIAAVIGAALLVYAFISNNFLFAVIVVMFAITLMLQTSRKPEMMAVTVVSTGVLFGGRFIPYRDLKSFWIVYEPPMTKSLYLDFKRAFFPHVTILLEDVDPVELRLVLKKYLPEDGEHEGEPAVDIFSKIFKI